MCDARTMYQKAGRLTNASWPSFCASEHLTNKVCNPVELGLMVWKDSTLLGRSKVVRVRIVPTLLLLSENNAFKYS